MAVQIIAGSSVVLPRLTISSQIIYSQGLLGLTGPWVPWVASALLLNPHLGSFLGTIIFRFSTLFVVLSTKFAYGYAFWFEHYMFLKGVVSEVHAELVNRCGLWTTFDLRAGSMLS